MTPEETAARSAATMWAEDRASQDLGMQLELIRPGRASLSMTVREDMVNGHAIGHGGFTFALADSAFAFACNTYNVVTVAAGAEIRFRRPVRLGDRLVATATERERQGRDGVYDVEVRRHESGAEDQELVASFVGRSRELGGPIFTEESVT